MAKFNNNDFSVTINGVTIPAKGRPTYQIVQADMRGRIYSDTDDSPQAGYKAKALLRSYEAYPIDDTIAEILLLGVNDLVDGDKITRDNFEAFMASVVGHIEAIKSATDQFGARSSEFYQARDSFRAYAKSVGSKPARLVFAAQYAKDLRVYYETGEALTRCYAFIDAKTSALQHQAYVTGNRAYAVYGGLAGAEAKDAYTKVGWSLFVWLQSGGWMDSSIPESAKASIKGVPGSYTNLPIDQLRKLAKLSVMVRTYGAGSSTMRGSLLKAAKKVKGLSKEEAADYATLIPFVMKGFETNHSVDFGDNGGEIVGLGPAPTEGGPISLEDWIKIFKSAYPADSFQGVSWSAAPGGFSALRASVVGRPNPSTVLFRGAVDDSLTFDATTLEAADLAAKAIREKTVSFDDSFRAMVPDLIHALDGEAMRLMMMELRRLGVADPFHIHDCVAVPIGHHATALEAFRRSHYAVYSAVGCDYLGYIANQRVAELEASKPSDDADAGAVEAWGSMLEAAKAAAEASTSHRYVEREGEPDVTVAQLVDLIHPSAFAPE